jgi:hypothetical protein
MAAKRKQDPAPNVAVRWAVRVIVAGILIVLLLLALADYRARTTALATGEAFRDAYDSEGELGDLLKSKLAPLVQGTPQVGPAEISSLTSPGLSVSAERYVWSSPLRTYTVTVGFRKGADPVVEVIEGPGKPAP